MQPRTKRHCFLQVRIYHHDYAIGGRDIGVFNKAFNMV